MRVSFLFVVAIVMMLFVMPLHAKGNEAPSNLPGEIEMNELQELGQKLVEKIWMLMFDADIEGLKALMAPGFQSIHTDGSRSAEEELRLIANLDLGEYKLSNFKITKNDDTIIATYFVSVSETIDEKHLTTEPAPRMTVFVKNDKDWFWLAHANLKIIQ